MASKFANKDYDWTEPFLAALREGATARQAAAHARINFTNAYDRRRTHKDFAAEWDRAKESAKTDKVEALEAALYKRGLEFSDNAAVALLKALAPEKYKDRSVVETVATDPTQARDELKAKLERLFAGSAAETAEKSEPC